MSEWERAEALRRAVVEAKRLDEQAKVDRALEVKRRLEARQAAAERMLRESDRQHWAHVTAWLSWNYQREQASKEWLRVIGLPKHNAHILAWRQWTAKRAAEPRSIEDGQPAGSLLVPAD